MSESNPSSVHQSTADQPAILASEAVPAWKLVAAYVALLALVACAASVPFLHLSNFGGWLSLLIALVKALVVAVVFMEIFKGSRLYSLAMLVGALWLATFFIVSSLDLYWR